MIFFMRYLLQALLFIISLPIGVAAAQEWAPPPPHYVTDDRGVDPFTGKKNYEKVDLSMGSESLGLKLIRMLNQGDPYTSTRTFGDGWSFNLSGRVYTTYIPTEDDPQLQYGDRILHLVIGNTTYTWIKMFGDTSWYPQSDSNATAVESGSGGTASVTFNINGFGTVVSQALGMTCNWRESPCGYVTSIVKDNGETISFTYDSSGTSGKRVKSIITNGGYAIAFDYVGDSAQASKACIMNLAVTYYAAGQSCPAGALQATYTYATSPVYLTGATLPVGGTETYSYPAGKSVTFAGDSIPQFTYESGIYKALSNGTVTYGGSWTYTLLGVPETSQTTVTSAQGTQTYLFYGLSKPGSFTDELGRNWLFEYNGNAASLTKQTMPEGDIYQYTRDLRGNVTEYRHKAKAGSGLADIVMTASYPASCSSPKSCNKPINSTDANGKITSFTYDAAHGGVLTETGPAVGGVAPVKRYGYSQRYAWIRNSAGTGYVQATTPIWLLTEVRMCKTTATIGNACSGGASDEVVTVYDYGPDSGPNNLLLRGEVVDAGTGKLNLRTCYGYDGRGNRISETSPQAGLGSCP